MMAERRVVRVTGFSRKPPRAPLREEDEGALERYITRPVETSVVIFIADDLDKRRKFSKTLLESARASSSPRSTIWSPRHGRATA